MNNSFCCHLYYDITVQIWKTYSFLLVSSEFISLAASLGIEAMPGEIKSVSDIFRISAYGLEDR